MRQAATRENAYRLEKMAAEQISTVKAFLAEHFGTEGPQNKPGWFEWQLRNPNGQHIQLCVDGDKIVALSVFMPVKLGRDRDAYSGAFSTNTMVDPGYQRRGIGKQVHLARIAQYDFALSSGQSESNYRLYMKMGFCVLSGYFETLLARRFPRPYFKKRYLREMYSWTLWRGVALFSSVDFRLEITDVVPTGMPRAFFVERFAPGDIGPVASEPYLEWRYVRHPYFRYQFVKVYCDQTWLGVAVIRENGDTVWLLDLYCRYSDMTRLLIALGEKLNALKIRGLFAGDSLRNRFTAARWHTFRHGSEYLGSTGQALLQHVIANRSWCLFYGDSDKER